MMFIAANAAVASTSAFTSREEMNRHSAEVIKNTMYRNTGNVPGTEQCTYIREYVVKYALNNHEHSSIWYYVMQCYDNEFNQVGDDTYSFNYDGDETKLYKLPPGCPPPVVEEEEKNPCANGIALGDKLYEDVSEIVTKKLTEHPLSAIGDEEPAPGTTKEVAEDGTVTLRHPDGTVEVSNPDGSSVTNLPDETLIEKTPEGVTTTTRKDGSIYVKNPDHSTVVTLPDGTVYEEFPDRSTRVVKPDGTVYEADTNGNARVTEPSGVTHTTHPDGTVVVDLNDDDETHTVNEDGTTVVSLPNGTSFADNQTETVVTEPNGTTHTADEQGNVTVNRPDDSTVVVNPDGSSVLTLPDGTTVTTTPSSDPTSEPTVVIRNSDGDEVTSVTGSEKPVVTNPSEGVTVTRNPDGSVVTTSPEGTVEERPDGSTLYTNPDKSTEEFAPNGSLTVKDPSGNTVKTFEPNGSSVENKPDGTTVNENPDGSSTETRPDESVLVRNPDGSAVLTKPNEPSVLINKDGSSVEERPDGSKLTTNTDGSSVEEKPDGSVVETDADGKVTVKEPSESDPNVLVVTSVVYADGTVPGSSTSEPTPVPTGNENIQYTDDGLQSVVKKIPELEEQLKQVLLNSMKENPTQVSSTDNQDGSRTVVYQYPDGTESTIVEQPNGDKVVTTVEKPSNNINVVEYNAESQSLVKTLKDPEGNVLSSSHHVAKEGNPNIEVVTYYDSNGQQVGLPEERPAAYDFLNPSNLTDLVITDSLQQEFLEAGQEYAQVLESYVDNNVKCFLENVLKERKYYLTFVCAHSEQKSIKEVLFAKYGENTICSKIQCEALERELIDRMLEASYAGQSVEGIEVVSNSYMSEIVDGDTSTGTLMDKEPTFPTNP